MNHTLNDTELCEYNRIDEIILKSDDDFFADFLLTISDYFYRRTAELYEAAKKITEKIGVTIEEAEFWYFCN